MPLAAFSDALNALFQLSPRSIDNDGNRELWTPDTLAAALGRLGVRASPSLLKELRTGTRLTDPRRSLLWGLAVVFDVPFGYFGDPLVRAATDDRLRESLAEIEDAP